jgi:hypothetical protein
MKKKRAVSPQASRSGAPSSPSPRSSRGEGRGEGRAHGWCQWIHSKVHKPHLDEMHGPESLPFRPGGAKPRKPELPARTKIFQPTDSRQSGPEFGPSPALQRRRTRPSRRMEEAVRQGWINRHCERSEAIHLPTSAERWIASSLRSSQ